MLIGEMIGLVTTPLRKRSGFYGFAPMQYSPDAVAVTENARAEQGMPNNKLD